MSLRRKSTLTTPTRRLKSRVPQRATPPTLLKGFFPESYPFTASADYKLLYNADLDQYNAIPDQGGAYRYFLLCYNAGSDTMQIYEYDLRYIPQ